MMTELPEPFVSRQSLTERAFVDLVDALVDDFDVVELLTILSLRCVELVGAAAAGILLANEAGELQVVGASSEQAGLLELFQIQNRQGPCLECFRTGDVVMDSDLEAHGRWPLFTSESLAAGFRSVCAVPLRLRDRTLGCLNLFLTTREPLPERDIALTRALADVATIAIVQDQATRAAALREVQLQHALESRVVIEQAKGMIAERAEVDLGEAFNRLRQYARSNNQGLTSVAEAIVAGTLPVAATNPRRRPSPG